MAQEIAEQIFVGQVTQKVFIERDGKVLISRDVGGTKWDLPGGRIHKGEEPLAGLRREIQEEIGVEVEISEPLYTDAFTFGDASNKSPGQDCFIVAYRATITDPSQPFVLAPDEIEEVRWLGREELETIPMWKEYKRALEVFFKISDK